MHKIDGLLDRARRFRAYASDKFITAVIDPSENDCRVDFSVWYSDSDRYEFNSTVHSDVVDARRYVDEQVSALQGVSEPLIFEMDYGFDGYED